MSLPITPFSPAPKRADEPLPTETTPPLAKWQPPASTSQRPSLEGRAIDTATPACAQTTQKTLELAQDPLIQPKSSFLGFFKWGFFKSCETAAFLGAGLEAIWSDSHQKLLLLTGGVQLECLLNLLSPHLVHAVQENLFEKGAKKDFLMGEEAFLANLTQAMVLKMAANLAEAVKKARVPSSDTGDLANGDAPVTLEEMTAFLCKMGGDKYALLAPEFARLETYEDPDVLNEVLRLAAAPAADELLAMLLPKGVGDLPLVPGVRWYLWSQLKNSVVPDLIVDLVQQTRKLQALPGSEAFKEMQGSDLVAAIIRKAAHSIASQSPMIVADNSQLIAEAVLTSLSPENAPSATAAALTDWLAAQIKDISLSESPAMQAVWDFAAKRSAALITYVFQALTAARQPTEECVLTASEKVMQRLQSFIAKNRCQIEMHKARLLQEGIDPLGNKDYLALFVPLARDLQQLTRLMPQNADLPAYFNTLADNVFSGQLPTYLAKYYDSYLVPLAQMHADKDPQKSHRFDVKILKTLIRAASPAATDDHIRASVKQTENLCGLIAEQVTSVVQNGIQAALIIENSEPPEQDVLSHPQWQAFLHGPFQINVQNTLFKILLNNIERQAAKGGNMQLSPLIALEDLSEAIFGHLADKGAQIQLAHAIQDPKQRQLALRALFEPLAGELLGVLNAANGGAMLPLPIPEALAKEAWQQVKATILPDLLAKLSLKSSALLALGGEHRAAIYERMPGSHIPEGCRVMAGWVCQFMPAYLGVNRQQIAESIFSAVAKHLKDSGNPKALSVESYLQHNEELVKQALCANMLGIPKSAKLRQLPMSAEMYVETLFLHVCDGVSRSLQNIEDPKSEKHQADAVVTLAIRLLNITKKHFEVVNQVTAEKHQSTPDQLSYKEMVQGFQAVGHALHKGVPQTPEGIAAHERAADLKKALAATRIGLEKLKQQRQPNAAKIAAERAKIKTYQQQLSDAEQVGSRERQTHFYVPFVEKLFKLTQLQRPADIPDAQWQMVQKQLVPQFLEGIFSNLLDPHTRNLMVINIFEKINDSLDAPAVSPYQSIADSMATLNHAIENVSPEKYDKKVYTAVRRLRNAMDFAAANPNDVIVKYRLKDLEQVMQHAALAGDEYKAVLAAWSGTGGVQQTIAAYFAEEKRKNKAKDPLQRKLNKACGELFLQLVQSVPYSAVKQLFKINKVNELTAEIIGEKLREMLIAQGSLAQIFDQAVATTASTMQPGKWENDGRQVRFAAEGAGLGLHDPLDLTEDEKEAQAVAKIYQARKDAAKAKEMIVSVGKKILVESVFDSLELPLAKLKEAWDATVDVIFGKYAPRLRQSIRFLGDQLFFRVCTIILSGMALPFRFVSGLISELYLHYRSSHFINFLQLEISEGLLYKVADAILITLNGDMPRPVDQWHFMTELLRAASLRTRHERERCQHAP